MAKIFRFGEIDDSPVDQENMTDADKHVQKALVSDSEAFVDYIQRLIKKDNTDLAAVPPHIKDFIENVENAAPLCQAELIHDFVNNNITPEDQWNQLEIPPSDLNAALCTTAGDCDDYVYQKLAMLHEAGFPADRVFVTTGQVTYSTQSGALTEGHAFIAIEIDGTIYVMDNNLEHLAALDEHGSSQGILKDHNVVVQFQIDEIYSVTSLDPEIEPIINKQPDIPPRNTETYKASEPKSNAQVSENTRLNTNTMELT